MICPKCNGNGYWGYQPQIIGLIEQLRVLQQVRQCETCNSAGKIEESEDAKAIKN